MITAGIICLLLWFMLLCIGILRDDTVIAITGCYFALVGVTIFAMKLLYIINFGV